MKYVSEPQSLPLEAYKNAQAAFLAATAQFPDIVSVYSGGTISQPGISDLDFVLGLKDQPTLPLNLDIEAQLPATVRGLIGGGTILKVPETYFPDIHLIDQLPLTHLQGKQWDITRYDSLWFKLCRIMDWLPERLFTLQKIQAAGASGADINVTRTLQILKSATVSLNLLETLVPDAATAAWMTQVKQLRENWFTNDNRLIDFAAILAAGPAVVQQAIWRTHDYISMNNYITPLPETNSLTGQFVIPHGPAFVFSSSREVKSDAVLLPSSFTYFLLVQAQTTDSWLCRQLQQSFTGGTLSGQSGQITSEWSATIKQRLRYVSEVADYFRRVGLTSGLLKYGWYLKA